MNSKGTFGDSLFHPLRAHVYHNTQIPYSYDINSGVKEISLTYTIMCGRSELLFFIGSWSVSKPYTL